MIIMRVLRGYRRSVWDNRPQLLLSRIRNSIFFFFWTRRQIYKYIFFSWLDGAGEQSPRTATTRNEIQQRGEEYSNSIE